MFHWVLKMPLKPYLIIWKKIKKYFTKGGFRAFKDLLVSTHKGLYLLMIIEFLLVSFNN